MAKIAVRSESSRQIDAGPSHGRPLRRELASGDGWAASDVVCTSGPNDRPFEEQFSQTCVAIVLGGTFQYRTSARVELLMMPGALLLGNAGDCFTCGHEHGVGDRCVSFAYTPEFYERVKAGAGISKPRFKTSRLAPTRALSPMVSRASQLLAGAEPTAFEELGIQVLAQSIQMEHGIVPHRTDAEPSSLARVTRVLRMIDCDPESPHDLPSLAQIAGLSTYHFLRVFDTLTGTTPHQYLLRARLRRAAMRLREEPTRILDIALGCGFGDLSNFNRSFRAEFGVTPRSYRGKM